ncbi:hypothetical protein ElyMa_005787300 [Elysia marginata]|uniref:Reverse transcriptase domain-containing protein n=1 Tax=Elysia marginata TaxID=1093978 RepID=A0AAV4FRG4_9GAST|nr:hypothetical protein ElyMa_005787300 [Elysia marginata]
MSKLKSQELRCPQHLTPDTIDRKALLDILKTIIDEDEKGFCQERLHVYADDVDFVSLEFIKVEEVQKALERHRLFVNVDKTDFTTLSRNAKDWRETKKVGLLIGDEDVERRKQLSTAALLKLRNIWIGGDKIKRDTKIKLYRALVKSILTYNCGTWALTQIEEDKLDAFHRKQLKQILNIKYPVNIKNESLYKKCNEKHLPLHILESRWRLFGHILRRDIEIPANKSMEAYFVRKGGKFLGRPITTLPNVLNNNKDLSRLPTGELRLKTNEDLDHLRSIAQVRQQWKGLTKKTREAAEASRSED